MSELNIRSSVMAVMEEVTEGIPVVPAAATDFIAMQDGFSLEPGFNNLENKELKNSIGKAKSIVGLEAPKASLNHYLRHSGVEGQAPNYKKFLKAVFGSEVVASAEYPTVSSSTVTLLKVNTGIGVNFQRGQGTLIKDGVNGYNIRPVHSVSGDDVTLGFDLTVAPGSGVNLGKAVLYKPLTSGHPTLTLWNYLANGGAIQMICGCRVTEASFDFSAGGLINGGYAFEGLKYFFDPIVIIAATSKLDFLDNSTTRVITVPAGSYKDPTDLAAAIQTLMNSLGSSNTFTCVYSNSSGKFTITSTGSTLTLKWNTGANTANSIAAKLGFSTAADSSGALTYTSPIAISFAAPFTPSYDAADPLVAKDNEVLIGDQTSHIVINPSKVSMKIQNQRGLVQDVTSVSGISGSVIRERNVIISVTALLNQYDADKFTRLRQASDTRFLYNAGVKSGGQWVPGKCVSIYIPTAVVASFKPVDVDGLVAIDFEIKAYVDSDGNGEAYLSFL